MAESSPLNVGLEFTDMKNAIVSIESGFNTFNEEITMANIGIYFYSVHGGFV